MGCIGDGWHKLGDSKVLVEDRVITQILMEDAHGDWTPHRIIRWNKTERRWQTAGKITPSAFRAGIRRGTMAVGNYREEM